jgi:hypothetical protein
VCPKLHPPTDDSTVLDTLVRHIGEFGSAVYQSTSVSYIVDALSDNLVPAIRRLSASVSALLLSLAYEENSNAMPLHLIEAIPLTIYHSSGSRQE